MTRLSKVTAILLLGAGMSLFAADGTAMTNTDQTAQTQNSDQTAQTQQNNSGDQATSQESETAEQSHQETAQNQQNSDSRVQSNNNQNAGNTQQNGSANNNEEHGAQAQAGSGINVEVQKIMQADPSKRRELMNQFKARLATMNQNERMEAITQLKSAMQAEGMHQAQMHSQEGAQMAQKGMKMGHNAMKTGMSGMNMAAMSSGNGAMQEGAGKYNMGSMMQGKIPGNAMPATAPQAMSDSTHQNHGAVEGANMAAMPQMGGSGMPTMVSQNGAASQQTQAAQPAQPAQPAIPAQPATNMATQPSMPSAAPQTSGRSRANGAMGMNMMGHR